MEQILKMELREKAGSDSYNRYEYQVHWICHHVIQSIKEKKDFMVFCEYHDDMAKQTEIESKKALEFYQVKTNDSITHKWTINKLTDRDKRDNGTYKNSFLGFIFYNFYKFSNECAKCHFVTNIGLDKELTDWQNTLQNGLKLFNENKPLYEKIRSKIIAETTDFKLTEEEFNKVFNTFIQNTFISRSNLTLDQYEVIVKGEFYEVINHYDLDVGNSYRLLTDILNLIRQKTRTIIDVPISYEDLVTQKGISSELFNDLTDKFSSLPKSKNYYQDRKQFLKDYTNDLFLTVNITKQLERHLESKLNIKNSLYIKVNQEFEKICDTIIDNHFEELNDLKRADELILPEIEIILKQHADLFEKNLLKGIFYEKIFQKLINQL